MSYTLVIVESPAKCEKIAKFLGVGYKVMGSFGHITQLTGLDKIDVADNYKPTFDLIDSKQSQISRIKVAVRGAKEVILASDDDREGEAIAWHICQVFNLNVAITKRIIFHEITERAIQNAIKCPGIVNMNLVSAQQGRQILDILVGFKISPVLWSRISSNSKTGLSAGRCQSPALRLVYENYREIKESPGKLSFNTVGYFTSQNIPFALNYNHDVLDDIEAFLEASKTFKHVLSKDPIKEIIKEPPSPFTTSGLQQMANNIMHVSPKETMELAQKLYEGGYITYMRTDSKVYCEEFIGSGMQYITDKYGETYVGGVAEVAEVAEEKKNTKKDKKKEKDNPVLAQEAHEAIRPTHIEMESIPDHEDVFTAKHRKLYRLIWSNTLESMMAQAVYKQMVVKISASIVTTTSSKDKEKDIFYKYVTEENVFPGWKIVQGVDSDKFYVFLNNLKDGDIAYKKITSKQTLKELKAHHTEAKLVQLLEQRGIGRPSTFSSLIEKIMERDYVKKQNIEGKKHHIVDLELEDGVVKQIKSAKEFGNEKNKLVITHTGIIVIEFLIAHFDSLFDYDYTKTMENDLDKIAKGLKPYHELCRECDVLIDTLCKESGFKTLKNEKGESEEKGKVVIAIDDKHTYMIGRNGPIIKYTKDNGTAGFYQVKPDIDLDRLKGGQYKLDDLIVSLEDNCRLLGEYKSNEVWLKNGKFGYYLECGEIKKSLSTVKINVPHKNIEFEDAIKILEKAEKQGNTLVREINENISIRKGQYNDYIFYKTEKMKKPQFFKLASFDGDYKTCNIETMKAWIKETYEI